MILGLKRLNSSISLHARDLMKIACIHRLQCLIRASLMPFILANRVIPKQNAWSRQGLILEEIRARTFIYQIILYSFLRSVFEWSLTLTPCNA